MGVHACTMIHVWRSEGNFLESVLSFDRVGHGEGGTVQYFIQQSARPLHSSVALGLRTVYSVGMMPSPPTLPHLYYAVTA